ncbi:PE-PPE domain-containing protein [Gordonia sp. CPCC 205515]|uniref:PE-PPE domain-containing protein n=1 Tax=Gordonia sp. CPCC 205515 TaxID=3140791 RepID=UPI003AF3F3B2
MLLLSGAVLTVALAVGQTFGSGVARADDSLPTGCEGPGRVFLVGGTWDTSGASVVGIGQRYQGTFPPGASPPPEGAYTTEVIDYPASIWPLGAFGFDDSQSQGDEAILAAVSSYQSTCGTDKEVVIAGYSQGAGVVGDALTDIGNGTTGEYRIDPTNVSGELYSDPRQAGTLWGRGVELVLVGVIPGLTMAGARTDADFGGIPVTTYCIAGDPICDLPDLLHDPVGAVDGLLGYWVKHGLYPFYMYLSSSVESWNMYGADRTLTCTPAGNVTTCVVDSPSSTAILTQRFVDAIGLNWTVPDLMQYRFTVPDILGITLADFQPPISWAMGWFPQLPNLGYGGVLPDFRAFEDVARGVLTLDPELFRNGVTVLAASAKSVVLMPVNFGGYWLYRVVGVDPNPFAGPAYRPSWEALKDWFSSLDPQASTGTLAAAPAAPASRAAVAAESSIADEPAESVVAESDSGSVGDGSGVEPSTAAAVTPESTDNYAGATTEGSGTGDTATATPGSTTGTATGPETASPGSTGDTSGTTGDTGTTDDSGTDGTGTAEGTGTGDPTGTTEDAAGTTGDSGGASSGSTGTAGDGSGATTGNTTKSSSSSGTSSSGTDSEES